MKVEAVNRDAIITAFLVALATGVGAKIAPLVSRGLKAMWKEMSREDRP